MEIAIYFLYCPKNGSFQSVCHLILLKQYPSHLNRDTPHTPRLLCRSPRSAQRNELRIPCIEMFRVLVGILLKTRMFIILVGS